MSSDGTHLKSNAPAAAGTLTNLHLFANVSKIYVAMVRISLEVASIPSRLRWHFGGVRKHMLSKLSSRRWENKNESAM